MGIRRVILGTGVFVAGAAVAGAITYAAAVRPNYRAWGVDPAEAGMPLPGDDLVPDANVIDTRGIDIAVPPEAVWPWLVQMGYGRAGWYSYDAMDMRGRSSDRVLPEYQALAAGDTIPTSPDTSFVVKAVEPNESLVLYFDEQLLKEQGEKARQAATTGAPPEGAPAGLRMSGAMMPSMPGFAASWTFALRPLANGHGTRLVERLRVKFSPESPGGRVAGSVFGVGAFAMQRKQMLGIRDRAEGAVAAGTSPIEETATTAGPVESPAEAAPVDPLAATRDEAPPAAPSGDEPLTAPA